MFASLPPKVVLSSSSMRPLIIMRCSPGMTLLRRGTKTLLRKVYPTPSSTLLRNLPQAAHVALSSTTDTLENMLLQPSGKVTQFDVTSMS